jgi:hypothetical protein
LRGKPEKHVFALWITLQKRKKANKLSEKQEISTNSVDKTVQKNDPY